MEFNFNDGSLLPKAKSPDEAIEVDLYNDLLVYSALPPEQREPVASPADPDQPVASSVRPTDALPKETYSYPEMVQIEEPEFELSIESKPANPEPPITVNASGPLSDLFPGMIINEASLLVCPHCNELSSGDDLFCIVCGGFLGESGVTPGLACSDCGESITEDELFCPSCGSVIS